MVDYIAVALLTYGGLRTLRSGAAAGLPALAGGWGFTVAMFYSSFFSRVEDLARPDQGPVDPVALTVTIGVLLLVAVAGFLLALVAAAREGRPSREPGS